MDGSTSRRVEGVIGENRNVFAFFIFLFSLLIIPSFSLSASPRNVRVHHFTSPKTWAGPGVAAWARNVEPIICKSWAAFISSFIFTQLDHFF